jgi:hypothetical protein
MRLVLLALLRQRDGVRVMVARVQAGNVNVSE